MKSREVISEFLNGNEVRVWNLFTENQNGKRVLYSYGYHFPLCVILEDGQTFINSETYSKTTAIHKGDLCRGLGYLDFKDLHENAHEIILLNSTQLKVIIDDEQINTKAEFIANKI